MDTSNAIASSSDGWDSEDVLKVLARVADAFDNPSLRKTDKELLFVVNVVKSRRLLTSLSSEESVCQDTTCGSSFDLRDVELVKLGDVGVWEHVSSCPCASRRYRFQQSRRLWERVFPKDNGVYGDVTQILLTSSPLDRLDRLAGMEPKKTGWFERTDKWSVVEMGLQKTPPRMPFKPAGFHVGESWEGFSPTKTTSPNRERQTLCSVLPPATDGGYRRERGYESTEQNQYHDEATKCSMPTSILQSADHSQGSDFLPG